jgi:hypothetical protein
MLSPLVSHMFCTKVRKELGRSSKQIGGMAAEILASSKHLTLLRQN